jgi:hypothetical protein
MKDEPTSLATLVWRVFCIRLVDAVLADLFFFVLFSA